MLGPGDPKTEKSVMHIRDNSKRQFLIILSNERMYESKKGQMDSLFKSKTGLGIPNKLFHTSNVPK